MGRKDQYLMKYSKRVMDQLADSTDMTIKQIMSAGVLAFADLPSEKKLEYVSRAQLGDLGRSDPARQISELLDQLERVDVHLQPDLMERVRVWIVKVYGPDGLKSFDDGFFAAGGGDKNQTEAPSGKAGRRTG